MEGCLNEVIKEVRGSEDKGITYLDRFYSKTIQRDNGCIEWIGYKNITGNKYGRFDFKKKKYLAHRLIWMHYNGDIPDKLEVRHTCHFPWCVNKDHLILGTHQDNMDDMVDAGRQGRKSVVIETDSGVYNFKSIGEAATWVGVGHRWFLKYLENNPDGKWLEKGIKSITVHDYKDNGHREHVRSKQ